MIFTLFKNLRTTKTNVECIYTNSYLRFFFRIQQAPFLVPFLPIKDIADEIKRKLTEDMKDLTPYELKVSMQCKFIIPAFSLNFL